MLQFLIYFFPMSHVPLLYGTLCLPSFALSWLTVPLYNVMLNGPDIADADFTKVNAGLAAVSGLTLIPIIIIFILGRKAMDELAQQPYDRRITSILSTAVGRPSAIARQSLRRMSLHVIDEEES